MHGYLRFNRHVFGGAALSGKLLTTGLPVEAVQRCALGLLGLAVGSLVLYATFYVAYGVVWFGYNFGVSAISELLFSKPLRLTHRSILCICWVFIGLLFVENQCVDRSHFVNARRRPGSLALIWCAGTIAALATLLINAGASAKAITDILLSGPHLVRWSLGAVWDSFRLLREHSLHETHRRAAAPEQEPQFRPAPDSWAAPSQEELACCATLGITPSASFEEIKAAYRRTMKLWHPDRHGERSEVLRQAAEEKTKAINAAYTFLLDRRRAGLDGADAGESNP